MTRTLRWALIGWGEIGQRIAQLTREHAPNAQLAAVAEQIGRSLSKPLPEHVHRIETPAQLEGLSLDLVVEAAGAEALRLWGPAALACCSAFIPASVSAFADEAFLQTLVSIANDNGNQILIPAGASAGIDALAAASLAGLDQVVYSIAKPPAAWRSTAAETLIDLNDVRGRVQFFEGSARDAARIFPQNANVTAICAMAGIGFHKTRIRLFADHATTMNGHELVAGGAFGRLKVEIENRPFPENPKSSQQAALSIVRLILGRLSPIVI